MSTRERTQTGRARLVLFDIDGTLLVSHGAGARAFTSAGRAVCGPQFSLDGITIGGAIDSVIYTTAARAMGIVDPPAQHDAFRERYLLELATELSQPKRLPTLLDGVTALLDMLAARSDVSVGLLTGNYERAAPIKLAAVGITHPFAAGAFGDHPVDRHELLPVALTRFEALIGHRFDPREVIIVGDTPRDVECAARNGSRCLAVATGTYSAAELADAGADRVVPDLTDPQALLSWLP